MHAEDYAFVLLCRVQLRSGSFRCHGRPCLPGTASSSLWTQSPCCLYAVVTHSLAQLQALYVGASDAREGGATVRTRIYDDLGAVPWPAYADGRALKNRFAELHVRGVPEQARRPCFCCTTKELLKPGHWHASTHDLARLAVGPGLYGHADLFLKRGGLVRILRARWQLPEDTAAGRLWPRFDRALYARQCRWGAGEGDAEEGAEGGGRSRRHVGCAGAPSVLRGGGGARRGPDELRQAQCLEQGEVSAWGARCPLYPSWNPYHFCN